MSLCKLAKEKNQAAFFFEGGGGKYRSFKMLKFILRIIWKNDAEFVFLLLFFSLYIYIYIYFILFYFLTLQYCIGFSVYQNESATGIHVFPILNPPPSSLPIPSLWVKPLLNRMYEG